MWEKSSGGVIFAREKFSITRRIDVSVFTKWLIYGSQAYILVDHIVRMQ